MRVLLVSRIDNRDALAFTEKIRAVLTEEGCDVILDSDTASSLVLKASRLLVQMPMLSS